MDGMLVAVGSLWASVYMDNTRLDKLFANCTQMMSLLLLFLHLCEGLMWLCTMGSQLGLGGGFFTFQKNEKLCNFWGLFTALPFLSKESKSALSDWKGSNFNNRLKNSLLYIVFFCLFCGVCYLWWPTRVSHPQKIGFHGLDFLMEYFWTIFFGQLVFFWGTKLLMQKEKDSQESGHQWSWGPSDPTKCLCIKATNSISFTLWTCSSVVTNCCKHFED